MNADYTIAMVHYHLRRGGVTRVMQNAVTALHDCNVRCVVVCGETPPDDFEIDAPVIVVKGLGYDEGGSGPKAEALLDDARAAVRNELGAAPDIWHIHNHALGKNAAWTRAVTQLAADGERLVLQIHDFAEDGRPANYRYVAEHLDVADSAEVTRMLYPQTARTHYALLTGRDRGILERAGVPESRARLLPNAIWTGGSSSKAADGRNPNRPLMLYPTRAIRRKNLGEFLLWSAMEQGGARYGVTLAPQSSGEVPHYERWKTFATEASLPVEFEMGMTNDFNELLASVTALVTTSIAEGFGLAFLEPWLSDRPLVGRDLPEITADFADEGIGLGGLYSELAVPLEWIDRTMFRDKIRKALTASRKAYGRDTADNDVETAVHAAVRDDRIEFSRLDEALQEGVIRRVCESAEARADVSPRQLMGEIDQNQIRDNRKAVEQRYGLEQYGARLISLYARVMESANEQANDLKADAVLEQFLDPAQFRLLRS